MERIDFKRNFLKEIILRVDFQGVFQKEMESILIESKRFLKEHGFNKYEEKNTTNIEVGPIPPTSNTLTVYVFSSDSLDYTVSISSSCVILGVRCASYSAFEDYSKIFLGIVNIFMSEIDFFTVKRLGLRKINQCFVKNASDVNDYFQKQYYDSCEEISDYSHISRERREQLVGKNSHLILKYGMFVGKIDENEVLQIVFDSDIFMDKTEEISAVLSDEKQLCNLNNTLFSSYINILTPNFIQILCGEKEIPDCLLGVEENE